MEIEELQKRLRECLVAQGKNLNEALKLHNKLNDYIIENGITFEIEETIDSTLEKINNYELFDKKISEHIKLLKKEIEELNINI